MLFRSAFSREQSAEGGKVEQIAFAGPDDQSDVSHQQQHSNLEQAARPAIRKAVPQNQGKEKGSGDAEQAADHRAEQASQAEGADPEFEEDDQAGSDSTSATGSPGIESKRAEEPAGDGKDKNEEQTKSK